MSEQADVELRLLSHPRNLCVARAAVEALLRRLCCDDGDAARVVLAVDEALSNVIRHGYDGRNDQPIWLRLWCNGDAAATGLRIVIDDEGRQVDPAQIVPRELEEVRPGGLGVHIIREVMDKVSYSARPGGGMSLSMTKRFSPSATPCPE